VKVEKHTLEYHRAMDSEQVAQRAKMGDQLDVAREVDQFAYFDRRAKAAAAAAELGSGGFRTSIRRKGLGTFLLEAHMQSPVEQAAVDEFVARMYDLVERHGGIYDGWGGTVVLRSAPPEGDRG
jgi:hypothetical protein